MSLPDALTPAKARMLLDVIEHDRAVADAAMVKAELIAARLRALLKDYPERMFLKCGVSQIPLVVGMING